MTNTNTQTSNQTKKNEQEIGALWKRVSKSGSQTYLSGHITVDELGSPRTYKVVVFSNKNKKNEKAPDFRIYLSKAPGETAVGATTPVKSERTVTVATQQEEELL